MKNISDAARYALGIFAVAAILGGCGGSSQFPNPAAQTPSGARTVDGAAQASAAAFEPSTSNASGKEHLVARAPLVRNCEFRGQGLECPFYIRGGHRGDGIATGPFPGTFKAAGNWTAVNYSGWYGWHLSEYFTITSGTSTIKGTISGSERILGCTRPCYPVFMGYKTSNGYAGKVLIKIIKRHDFRETLFGM